MVATLHEEQATITAIEQAAYGQMQGRLIDLLLRHHERTFASYYGEMSGYATNQHPLLRHYRNLAVLFYLRDHLFEHILPQIVRRLSFESPRERRVEEPPARGRVDWERTLNATWNKRPGEPPLELHTRQRRRDFATPENVLTVATLLEYRTAVEEVLWTQAAASSDTVRHPLNDIIDRVGRELAFPQFAGLRATAEAALMSTTVDIESLEAQVAERVADRHDSPYAQLLDWRRRFQALDLLDRTPLATTSSMLGADPARDNYLYQLWLFYELADLLDRRGLLDSWENWGKTLLYHWGQGNEQRYYRMQHDQAIRTPQHTDKQVQFDQTINAPQQPSKTWNPWNKAPGVRPDLYIEHVTPRSVWDADNNIVWREPGYVLDAKYYKPRDSVKAPGNPVKRMLADLQLTDERRGALLFAFQQAAVDSSAVELGQELEQDVVAVPLGPQPLYEVQPRSSFAQHTQPDILVGIWRVQPSLGSNLAPLEGALVALLDHVHHALKDRIEVACHGVFLDTLTATGNGTLAGTANLFWRGGDKVHAQLDEILVCPKPHVGPWRVDLVSLSRDCCRNGEVCHIINRADARKPKRLTALDEIASAIQASAGAADDESVTTAATNQVLAITKRYAQLLQPNIEEYKEWIRDELDVGELFDTTLLLTHAQRETLALARFLWEQIDHIRATNYAGPTLLFTGVLEEVTRSTIFKQSGKLHDANGRPLQDTLGTIGNSVNYGGHNFVILENAVVERGHWYAQINEHQLLQFRKWIDLILKVSFIRNEAAHKANVTPKQFRSLTDMYFGSPIAGIGVLNGLLLAWRDLPAATANDTST